MAELRKFPSRQQWLKARREGCGGSDAPAIVGVDPYRSTLEIYTEKLAISEPQEDTDILWWGRKLQPIIAQAYRRETGRKLEYFGNHFFVNAERPHLFASLDALIVEPKGVLEIKASEIVTEGQLKEEIPLWWQVQLQHCLGVMELELGSFSVPLPHRRLFWIDVPADKEFIALLFEKEDAFMKRVQERRPPDPDASESARWALQKLYPRDTGKEIILPEAAIELDRKRIEAMAAIEQMQAIKTQSENDLKAMLGDATTGIIGDGLSYTWKHQHKDSYIVKEQDFRVLRRHEKKK